MITITKEEASAIRKEFDDVHIVRLKKQDSKRHHYFVSEEPKVMKFVKQIRR